MSNKFEDRLATALTHTLGLNPERVAATLIAQGIVADPVQHQQDLTAIMDKQVRDAAAWRDQYCTHGVDDDGNEQPAVAWTTDRPEWERGVPVYHRRVTEWREVHRA